MTLTIELPPAVERQLRQRAEKAGVPAADLAADALQRWLDQPPTWEEVVAPVAAQVAASGMTEDEIDAFFQEVREEVWQDRKRRGEA